MTMRIPDPASRKSLPEASLSLYEILDKEPKSLWQHTSSSSPTGSVMILSRKMPVALSSPRDINAAETATEAMEEGQDKKKMKKNKRRRRGSSNFKPLSKRKMWGSYVPVLLDNRKRAPKQRRQQETLRAAHHEVECCIILQRDKQDCISPYYLAVPRASSTEE